MAEFNMKCPDCQKDLVMQDEWVGMDTQCPLCQHSFTITKPVLVTQENTTVKKLCIKSKLSLSPVSQQSQPQSLQQPQMPQDLQQLQMQPPPQGFQQPQMQQGFQQLQMQPPPQGFQQLQMQQGFQQPQMQQGFQQPQMQQSYPQQWQANFKVRFGNVLNKVKAFFSPNRNIKPSQNPSVMLTQPSSGIAIDCANLIYLPNETLLASCRVGKAVLWSSYIQLTSQRIVFSDYLNGEESAFWFKKPTYISRQFFRHQIQNITLERFLGFGGVLKITDFSGQVHNYTGFFKKLIPIVQWWHTPEQYPATPVSVPGIEGFGKMPWKTRLLVWVFPILIACTGFIIWYIADKKESEYRYSDSYDSYDSYDYQDYNRERVDNKRAGAIIIDGVKKGQSEETIMRRLGH